MQVRWKLSWPLKEVNSKQVKENGLSLKIGKKSASETRCSSERGEYGRGERARVARPWVQVECRCGVWAGAP